MSIISRQEKLNDKWLTWIPLPNLSCLLFETNEKLTEEEAQVKLDEWEASQEQVDEPTE